MRLVGVVQEVTHNGIRDERRNDQCFVLPRAEGRNGSSVQSRNPEAALVFIEALRPGEPHASQFVRNLRHPLTTLARERVTRRDQVAPL